MVSSATVICACGRPIHYTDRSIQAIIEGYVRDLGPSVIVEIEGRRYHVQRHYLALHGLKAAEIDRLVAEGIVRRA